MSKSTHYAPDSTPAEESTSFDITNEDDGDDANNLLSDQHEAGGHPRGRVVLRGVAYAAACLMHELLGDDEGKDIRFCYRLAGDEVSAVGLYDDLEDDEEVSALDEIDSEVAETIRSRSSAFAADVADELRVDEAELADVVAEAVAAFFDDAMALEEEE